MATSIQYVPGWNGGANTIATLVQDGYYTFQLGQRTGICVGLSKTTCGGAYSEIEHAFLVQGNLVSVYESGVLKYGPVDSVVESKTFKIERIARNVRYYLDSVLLYSSLVQSLGTVWLDSAFYAKDDTIIDAEVTALPSNDDVTGSGALRFFAQGMDTDAGDSGWVAFGFAGSAYVTDYSTGDGQWAFFAAGGEAADWGSGQFGFSGLGTDLAILDTSYAYPSFSFYGYGTALTDVAGTASGTFRFDAKGLETNINYGDGRIRWSASGTLADIPPALLWVELDSILEAGGTWNSAALVLPALTLRATGGVNQSSSSSAFTLPALSLVAYSGGTAECELPELQLTAAGTAAVIGVSEFMLPALTLVATGTVGAIGTAKFILPELQLLGFSGGYARFVLPELTLASRCAVTIIGTATLVLPSLVMASAGTARGAGQAQLTLPELILTSQGVTGAVGSAAFVLPPLNLVAIGAEAVTETTYAVNLSTGAVTALLMGVFDKLVTAHGRLYGLQGGALVRLDGDLDGAATIPMTIRFAPQQFGTYAAKRLDGHVYLNTRENNGVTLTVVHDETTSWAYQTATDTAPAMGTHRVKVGRGITFHSLGLTLQNRNGGRLDIGGIELPVLLLSRKPR